MFEISLGENGDMAFSGSEKYAVSLESSHVWKVKEVLKLEVHNHMLSLAKLYAQSQHYSSIK